MGPRFRGDDGDGSLRRLLLHKELSSSGLTGRSSTPRLLDFITNVSGILDHPLSRVMTTENVARPSVIARSEATKQSIVRFAVLWIASLRSQ
jgi:hypothetical protein